MSIFQEIGELLVKIDSLDQKLKQDKQKEEDEKKEHLARIPDAVENFVKGLNFNLIPAKIEDIETIDSVTCWTLIIGNRFISITTDEIISLSEGSHVHYFNNIGELIRNKLASLVEE